MANLKDRIQILETEIAAAAKKSGRKRSDITLVAVSKTYPADLVKEAISFGLSSFGENYVQEALPKIAEVGNPDVQWHFIGHLQSNKAKSVVGKFAMIHSIDSFSTAQELSKRVDADPNLTDPQKILIEVNLGQEATKTGIQLKDLKSLIDEIQELPYVQICGLMAMPPLNWEPEELRREFNHLRDERDRLATRLSAPHSLVELSMGTSHDFAEAIQAGSTMIRVGTRIFGERKG